MTDHLEAGGQPDLAKLLDQVLHISARSYLLGGAVLVISADPQSVTAQVFDATEGMEYSVERLVAASHDLPDERVARPECCYDNDDCLIYFCTCTLADPLGYCPHTDAVRAVLGDDLGPWAVQRWGEGFEYPPEFTVEPTSDEYRQVWHTAPFVGQRFAAMGRLLVVNRETGYWPWAARSAQAFVIDDEGETFEVHRSDGGYSCACEAANGDCGHGWALRHVLGEGLGFWANRFAAARGGVKARV